MMATQNETVELVAQAIRVGRLMGSDGFSADGAIRHALELPHLAEPQRAAAEKLFEAWALKR